MKWKELPILRTDLHFIWVILFFIIHGYSQYYKLIPFSELIILTAKLLAIGAIFYWISLKLFKSSTRAGLFTSFTLALMLFFGVIQDFFGGIKLLAPLSSLRVTIAIVLVVIISGFLLLKRKKVITSRIVVFLNTLFIVYLLIDTGRILFYETRKPIVANSFNCDTCSRPPIYFILLDEYFGSDGLKEYMGYDNSRFENQLRTEGFRVIQHPRSNYSYTVFSIASMLNMDYIHDLGPQKMNNHYGYKKSLRMIRESSVCEMLINNGYTIKNYSLFDLSTSPALSIGLIEQNIGLITNTTMYHRIRKNLPYWLAEDGIADFRRQHDRKIIQTNQQILKSTIEDAKEVKSPVFNYIHLLMPHDPFAYDSLGRKTVAIWEKGKPAQEELDDAYLQYLVYCNNVILSLVRSIKQETSNKVVILLMGDHGYRAAGLKNIRHTYQTLNAVYLPSGNYQQWYDGMTNVNQFRALFNTLFNRQMPMLKDSVVMQ